MKLKSVKATMNFTAGEKAFMISEGDEVDITGFYSETSYPPKLFEVDDVVSLELPGVQKGYFKVTGLSPDADGWNVNLLWIGDEID